MSDWRALSDELDCWKEAGKTARLWWRDDDAAFPSVALDQLLHLGSTHIQPVLAVIPNPIQKPGAKTGDLVGLAASLPPEISIVQHGYTHANQAGENNRKSEFPSDPSLSAQRVFERLRSGQDRLQTVFSSKVYRPVFVPPWNRIASRWVPLLVETGFAALSCYEGTSESNSLLAAPVGLVTLNTHVDITDWRTKRQDQNPATIAPEILLTNLIRWLRHYRQNNKTTVPIGLLTHHLILDTIGRTFLAALFVVTSEHSACRWEDPTYHLVHRLNPTIL